MIEHQLPHSDRLQAEGSMHWAVPLNAVGNVVERLAAAQPRVGDAGGRDAGVPDGRGGGVSAMSGGVVGRGQHRPGRRGMQPYTLVGLVQSP